jgi:hypothetical protein
MAEARANTTHFHLTTIVALAACLALLVIAPRAAFGELSVRELIRRADMVMRSKTSAAVFAMEIKAKRYQRTLKVVLWDDARGKDKTLVKILGPALFRGYGTLKLGSQLKLYNPRNNHVTIVGSSMLGDAWMGSHFTNDDLVKETRLARHYRAQVKRSYSATAPDGKPAKHYLLTLIPKPTAPVAWGRIDYLLWVRGELVLPIRADYFRKAKDRVARRAIVFGGVKRLGGRLVPSAMRVTLESKPGEFTEIRYKRLRFDIAIPQSKFTEQALRR